MNLAKIFTLSAATLLALAGPARAAEPDIRRDAAVTAIERVLPSVVNIATETVIEYHDFYDELLRQFYGWSRTPQKSVSLGSGVIIDKDGYVRAWWYGELDWQGAGGQKIMEQRIDALLKETPR